MLIESGRNVLVEKVTSASRWCRSYIHACYLKLFKVGHKQLSKQHIQVVCLHNSHVPSCWFRQSGSEVALLHWKTITETPRLSVFCCKWWFVSVRSGLQSPILLWGWNSLIIADSCQRLGFTACHSPYRGSPALLHIAYPDWLESGLHYWNSAANGSLGRIPNQPQDPYLLLKMWGEVLEIHLELFRPVLGDDQIQYAKWKREKEREGQYCGSCFLLLC